MAPKNKKNVKTEKLQDTELDKIAGGIGRVAESARFLSGVRDAVESGVKLEERSKLKQPELAPTLPDEFEATEAKEVKLSLSEIYKVMTMGKPIDENFAQKLKAVTEETLKDLQVLPDHYDVDGKLEDGGTRKQSVIDLLEKLKGSVEDLQKKTVLGLVKSGVSGALDVDGTLKTVLTPLVHAISQFSTGATKNPAQRLMAEKEVINHLTEWVKALPSSVLTEKKLQDYAGQLGNTGKSSEELIVQYRKEQLHDKTKILTDSLQKLGLSAEAAAALTEAITEPLQAGKSLAPRLLVSLGKSISDPYDLALVGHIAKFAGRVTSLLAPTKEKPLAFLSDTAFQKLNELAKKNEGLRDALGRLTGNAAKRGEKFSDRAVVLQDVGTILTRNSLGSRNELSATGDPVHQLAQDIHADLATNLSKDWDKTFSNNRLSRMWNSVKATFSGRENVITQISNLNKAFQEKKISLDQYTNEMALIKQKTQLPKWIKSFVEKSQEKMNASQDILSEKSRTIGQQMALKIAETDLAKSVEGQRGILRAIGMDLDAAKTSLITGFTDSDRDLLKNWMQRFDGVQQESWQANLKKIQAETDPQKRMELIDGHGEKVRQHTQDLQQIQIWLKEGINDDNYAQVMGKAALLAGIPESEVPKRVAQAVQEEKANAVAVENSGAAREKVTDVKQMSKEQLSARASELMQTLQSPDFWRGITSSDTFADKLDSSKFTSGDKKDMKALTEKYAKKLAEQMVQAPDDFALQKRNVLALTRLTAQLEGISDANYKTVFENVKKALGEFQQKS